MRYSLTSLLLLREALILTPLPYEGRGWGLGFLMYFMQLRTAISLIYTMIGASNLLIADYSLMNTSIALRALIPWLVSASNIKYQVN
jgi:hypothetical protein